MPVWRSMPASLRCWTPAPRWNSSARTAIPYSPARSWPLLRAIYAPCFPVSYLQRMSGIATYTHQLSALLEGTGITLLDTRKTSPNNRIFEKYAVRVGGGSNHRTGLSDGVLLKDNHIGAAGGVAKAVKMARQYASFVRKIEVEVETLEQVKEAVEAGADIIMLDNMSDEDMRKAVTLIAGRAKTECSGNVTRENIARLRDIGIDYVSSGALTHSAPILDLSMKHLRPLTAEEA